jgi:GTP-binding protein
MFVDQVTVELQAGDGGAGCVSFRRERYVPRGGPDGGDGGNGGSIVVIAEQGVDSLNGLAHRKLWKAKRGTNGQGSKRNGRRADDLIIRVPPGTIIIDAADQFVIKDLASPGDQIIAAHGGRGGRGNVHFRSAANQAPRECSPGAKGEYRRVTMELKVIADVGLVGKPNAGKSTLLSRLSHARPEIADYPFTTKHPNLGRVQIDIDRSFVMADIPGLIEGAHAGAGLGHEFLKHIERTGVLVHLVEPTPMDGTDPVENYTSIRDELRMFNENLMNRPEIVCVTKAELPDATDVCARLSQMIDQEVLLLSAVTGQGLNRLTTGVVQAIDARAEQ